MVISYGLYGLKFFWTITSFTASLHVFKAILTSSWSIYLVSTNLIKKLNIIFVLAVGLNFFFDKDIIHCLPERF